jgi:hypothetical protein
MPLSCALALILATPLPVEIDCRPGATLRPAWEASLDDDGKLVLMIPVVTRFSQQRGQEWISWQETTHRKQIVSLTHVRAHDAYGRTIELRRLKECLSSAPCKVVVSADGKPIRCDLLEASGSIGLIIQGWDNGPPVPKVKPPVD